MHVLILGGNSDIGFAIAEQFAQHDQANITLASRNMTLLNKKTQDLMVRFNVHAEALAFDACDVSKHSEFYHNLQQKPDIVIVAFGYLGSQTRAQADFNEARTIIDTNYTGAVSIIEIIAADFVKRQQGIIVGISSVAGLRGRRSNYIYGSAKAGLTTYLSGLRARMTHNRIHVLTVLLGFVATKMTASLSLPALLTSSATSVAKKIHHAIRKKRLIIYTPGYWRFIMLVVRMIPERLMKQLEHL